MKRAIAEGFKVRVWSRFLPKLGAAKTASARRKAAMRPKRKCLAMVVLAPRMMSWLLTFRERVGAFILGPLLIN